MKLFVFWFIQCTWGILQTLLGFVCYLICRLDKRFHKSAWGCAVLMIKRISNYSRGLSLGPFILLSAGNANMVKHEYGHCKQSLILGPLYLFVVGIPSLIWAWCFHSWRLRNGVEYNWFYTERWADRLGGVEW